MREPPNEGASSSAASESPELPLTVSTGGAHPSSHRDAFSRRRFIELASGSLVAGLVGCDALGRAERMPRSAALEGPRPFADIAANSVGDFLRTFEGQVVRPSDPPYDTLRRTRNFKYDAHPGLIAVCANVSDVQRTVSFAAEHDVLLAVRSGGHSMAGHSSCDGGIVLVTLALQDVTVDASAHRAQISAGATIGAVDVRLAEYGLATPGASAATVGYAGFATGGGRGTLSPRFGYACDNFHEVDIVTADGQLRTLNALSDPELFWAIRGGGGNFGVATRFDVRVYDVPDVVAGRIVYPFSEASSTLKRIRDLFDAVPDDLYVAPLLAGTPEGPVLALSLLYCGPKERAESVVAPYRTVGTAVLDTVSTVRYLDTQGWFPGPPPATATEGCTGFFPSFSDQIIDAIVASAGAAPPSFAMACFSTHGAMADRNLDDNAYPLREKGVDFFAMGFWTSPADRTSTELWIRELWTAVGPSTRGASVNGVFDRSPERAREVYRDKYERLGRVKARYDPNNLFSQNVNIVYAS